MAQLIIPDSEKNRKKAQEVAEDLALLGNKQRLVTNDLKTYRDRKEHLKNLDSIFKYLKESEFDPNLKRRDLTSPHKKLFEEIYKHLYHKCNPVYEFDKNVIDGVVPSLNVLKCPFTSLLKKSTFISLGSPSSWTLLSAMLNWLVKVIQTADITCENRNKISTENDGEKNYLEMSSSILSKAYRQCLKERSGANSVENIKNGLNEYFENDTKCLENVKQGIISEREKIIKRSHEINEKREKMESEEEYYEYFRDAQKITSEYAKFTVGKNTRLLERQKNEFMEIEKAETTIKKIDTAIKKIRNRLEAQVYRPEECSKMVENEKELKEEKLKLFDRSAKVNSQLKGFKERREYVFNEARKETKKYNLSLHSLRVLGTAKAPIDEEKYKADFVIREVDYSDDEKEEKDKKIKEINKLEFNDDFRQYIINSSETLVPQIALTEERLEAERIRYKELDQEEYRMRASVKLLKGRMGREEEQNKIEEHCQEDDINDIEREIKQNLDFDKKNEDYGKEDINLLKRRITELSEELISIRIIEAKRDGKKRIKKEKENQRIILNEFNETKLKARELVQDKKEVMESLDKSIEKFNYELGLNVNS
ncbi:hypothetical protein K502DRAFT_341707 [Neoconidiobolus thromboides FSU 785]|nr:hypothetical protein K502DRAFT_341707 [Neoconidiobolus thromboides FSU 785]